MRKLTHTAPFGILALIIALCTGRPVLGQAADLPAARTIIDKYIAAIGGEKAWMAISSMHATGTLEMTGMNLSGAVDLQSARPAKTRLHLELAGIGVVEEGFDGAVGWSTNPMSGATVAKGRELLQDKDDADFDAPLHKPSQVKSMTTVEKADFDGHQTYKVKVVMNSGIERFEYYDTTTFLQVGYEDDHETPMGSQHQVQMIRAYKKFGDLMQPTELVVSAMSAEQALHIATYEYDKVPASAFELPAEVKALIK